MEIVLLIMTGSRVQMDISSILYLSGADVVPNAVIVTDPLTFETCEDLTFSDVVPNL